MRKRFIQLIFILIFLISGKFEIYAQNDYTAYVNPMVGTAGHGHTFPGATLPFAMVQLSPDTRIDGSWDGCSGYHFSDKLIYGFSHTHLSGTGCSDYGDIAFLPFYNDNTKDTWANKNFVSFSHDNEKAVPGYYSVSMDNGIRVELSSSIRTGIQRYTFSKAGTVNIKLDLQHRDELLQGRITLENAHTFHGFRRSKAWAQDQLLFFHTELSRDADRYKIFRNDKGDYLLILSYHVKIGEQILIKTALSSVDDEGAKANMTLEMPHWDYDKVKTDAAKAWNKELGRIQVFGGSNTERQNFYTALYHCMIHPNVMNDVDGRYRGRDKEIHKVNGYNYYTVFSLWDTYRALHPLLNIIDKRRSRDFIMTFRDQFEQSGRLPMWELWGNETNCMIGFHSVSVILDAYKRGVINLYDLNTLYPAVKAEALSNRFGLDKFRNKGFLSIEDESESVSKTLEYSYDMWCVARIAEALMDLEGCQYALKLMDEMNMFDHYAEAWKNLYDVKTGFMTPRSNGGWIKDFDPRQVNNHFTEANAWQYRFAVQQDYRAVSSDEALSALFNAGSKTTGREQSDITGLIGQYAHGNEPSHHFAYLFNSQDSVNKYIKQICRDFYNPGPDGLCGNEDCGQMSAWYVFSAMGYYPVCPGSNELVKGVSLFDSVYVNGTNIKNMQAFNSPAFSKPYNRETRFSAPVISAASMVFEDSLLVQIELNMPENKEYFACYTINGSELIEYKQPFYIKDNAEIKAYLCSDVFKCSKTPDMPSGRVIMPDPFADTAIAYFYKRPNNYDIQIRSTPNKQYTAGGQDALLDGLKGDINWRKGLWQGYQSQDFEAVVDMHGSTEFDSVCIGFLQDRNAWIFLPVSVAIYGSNDSTHFTMLDHKIIGAPDGMGEVERKEVVLKNSEKKKTYRYIKVMAYNFGKLPKWHAGAGDDAFIFIDEIDIRK